MSSRNLLDIRKKAVKRIDSARRALPLRYEAPKTVRLKTRRRHKQLFMFCICLLGAAGLVGGLGAASHVEKFAIHEISVTGAQALSPEALTAVAGETLQDEGFRLFSRKNMFLYPRSAIESALSADFPRIKKVSAARQSLLAQAVMVTIEERKPFATWCGTDEKCYALDANGFIYAPLGGEASLMGFAEAGLPAQAGDVPATPYVFRGGLIPNTDGIGQTFLRGRIQSVVHLLDDLESAGFKATGITVDSEKDFTVTLENGLSLLASFEMPGSDILRNLQTALEAEGLHEKLDTLEYIDLRFGNRVYYK